MAEQMNRPDQTWEEIQHLSLLHPREHGQHAWQILGEILLCVEWPIYVITTRNTSLMFQREVCKLGIKISTTCAPMASCWLL